MGDAGARSADVRKTKKGSKTWRTGREVKEQDASNEGKGFVRRSAIRGFNSRQQSRMGEKGKGGKPGRQGDPIGAGFTEKNGTMVTASRKGRKRTEEKSHYSLKTGEGEGIICLLARGTELGGLNVTLFKGEEKKG